MERMWNVFSCVSRMWAVQWSKSPQGRSRFLWTPTPAPESRPSRAPSPRCWFPAASLNPATLTWSNPTRCSSECQGPATLGLRSTAWPTESTTTTEVSRGFFWFISAWLTHWLTYFCSCGHHFGSVITKGTHPVSSGNMVTSLQMEFKPASIYLEEKTKATGHNYYPNIPS